MRNVKVHTTILIVGVISGALIMVAATIMINLRDPNNGYLVNNPGSLSLFGLGTLVAGAIGAILGGMLGDLLVTPLLGALCRCIRHRNAS